MSEQQEIHVKVRTTPKQGREFLEKLASDDDFRARVEREPKAALAEYGVDVPDHALPQAVTLPPREHVQGMLAHLNEQDELGKTGHLPHGYALLYCVLGAMPLVDAR